MGKDLRKYKIYIILNLGWIFINIEIIIILSGIIRPIQKMKDTIYGEILNSNLHLLMYKQLQFGMQIQLLQPKRILGTIRISLMKIEEFYQDNISSYLPKKLNIKEKRSIF